MARTLSLDNLLLQQLHLLRDVDGTLQVTAEFTLRAGAQAVQTKHMHLTRRLSAARQSQVVALFGGLAQDLATTELV